ncbi:hypothetical protein [Thalassolituus hydrocarboniclasticus]|uniref:Uncharacterized protein n=1 Tax=Thalassolituus hydrocarboniclasticus TaxID=2742796 RepID=A0ABY6A9X6_9GAMM|nr:hypothetical protein [Thalassolituus hydrocarboniclasticus]UXD87056.1 hypothetical protein HUF19_06190 [Thalassolituus hydrocarboniclasticus]
MSKQALFNFTTINKFRNFCRTGSIPHAFFSAICHQAQPARSLTKISAALSGLKPAVLKSTALPFSGVASQAENASGTRQPEFKFRYKVKVQ